MNVLRGLTLRQMLTIPYVALVLVAALVIGSLSYNTGKDAVDTLSDYLLKETVERISQAVERHVSGASAVLETAFPTGVWAPENLERDIGNLRTRFWLATSVHRDPNNYAYYGDREGRFFGLWRYSENEAEIRLRTDATPRKVFRFTGIQGALENPRSEERNFDPRERPWYKAGQSKKLETWTSIYIDFKSLQLVSTQAKRVNNNRGEFQGVVATDLSLEHLNSFLKQLKLSPNGFAIVFEPDGNLIATSRGPHLRKGVGEDNQRLNAADSTDPLIVATYKETRALMTRVDEANITRTSVFNGPDGNAVQVGYARVKDTAGLDWIIAVAVPRSDFLSGITSNVKRTAVLAMIAALMIIATGYFVLSVVTADLRKLAQVTRDVGNGFLDTPVNVERNDELGDLAKSFSAMQQRLLTDQLTGLANREAMLRQLEERIIQRRRNADPRSFAVVFVDLNRFKGINDSHGHDAGDQVLRLVGERMRDALRSTDLVARYGGDEFVIMLEKIDSKTAAQHICEALIEKLNQPLTINLSMQDLQIQVGASFGIACYPNDAQDIDSLIKAADADMYRQKQISPRHNT